MTSEIHPPPTEFTAEEIKLDDVLRFFHYGHLPPTLQSRSRPFCDLTRSQSFLGCGRRGKEN